MTIEQLLNAAAPGSTIIVQNIPFRVTGKMKVVLDGGDIVYWVERDGGGFLSIDADAEELVMFDATAEDLEPSDDTVVHGGKDYEFAYEDHGEINSVDGAGEFEEGDTIKFVEYESEAGGLVRIITNEQTGAELSFTGEMITEDDIQEEA